MQEVDVFKSGAIVERSLANAFERGWECYVDYVYALVEGGFTDALDAIGDVDVA